MSRLLVNRTESDRSVAYLTQRERLLVVGDHLPNRGNMFWQPNEIDRVSQVTPSGTPATVDYEAVAPRPGIRITGYTGTANGDISCLLWPADIAAGQTWEVSTGRASSDPTGEFNMTALVMTDGVTTGSNIMAAWGYQSTANVFSASLQFGTITNLASAAGGVTPGSGVGWRGGFRMRLTWTGTAFQYSYVGEFDDVLIGPNPGTPQAFTITPTHIGVGYTDFGTATPDVEAFFGPVVQIA